MDTIQGDITLCGLVSGGRKTINIFNLLDELLPIVLFLTFKLEGTKVKSYQNFY